MQIDDFDLCTALGRRLRKSRKLCCLTQEQLAEKSNVSSRHISKIENGEMNPSYEVLQSLITAMNISADTLFFSSIAEDDLLFEKFTILYRACPEEKRELLLRTVEFIIANLLSDDV